MAAAFLSWLVVKRWVGVEAEGDFAILFAYQ